MTKARVTLTCRVTEGSKRKAACHPPAITAESYEVSDSAVFEMGARDPSECGLYGREETRYEFKSDAKGIFIRE